MICFKSNTVQYYIIEFISMYDVIPIFVTVYVYNVNLSNWIFVEYIPF